MIVDKTLFDVWAWIGDKRHPLTMRERPEFTSWDASQTFMDNVANSLTLQQLRNLVICVRQTGAPLSPVERFEFVIDMRRVLDKEPTHA